MMLIQCPECIGTVPEGANFCPHCGANLSKDCRLKPISIYCTKKQSEDSERGVSKEDYKLSLEQLYLGYKYNYGIDGVEKDIYEAVKYYSIAAKYGNNYAKYKIGDHSNYSIKELETDYYKFKNKYNIDFEKCDIGVQQFLGLCYFWGAGVKQDFIKAINAFIDASCNGDVISTLYVGLCYFNGLGVEKDYIEATRYFSYSSSVGDPTSQYMLGMCYFYGMGIFENKEYGIKLLTLASNAGNIYAEAMLKKINSPFYKCILFVKKYIRFVIKFIFSNKKMITNFGKAIQLSLYILLCLIFGGIFCSLVKTWLSK